MNYRLKHIIEKNISIFSQLQIKVEQVESSKLNFIESAEQVDLFSAKTFARITLFESNRLYIQILDIQTEETIFFYDDFLDKNVNLEKFIMQLIKQM